MGQTAVVLTIAAISFVLGARPPRQHLRIPMLIPSVGRPTVSVRPHPTVTTPTMTPAQTAVVLTIAAISFVLGARPPRRHLRIPTVGRLTVVSILKHHWKTLNIKHIQQPKCDCSTLVQMYTFK